MVRITDDVRMFMFTIFEFLLYIEICSYNCCRCSCNIL